MQSEPPVGRQTYAGLFLVTMATLAHEILLTRIFSVTLWYHFAFMAISIAMFGTTVGGIFGFDRFLVDADSTSPTTIAFLLVVGRVVSLADVLAWYAPTSADDKPKTRKAP